MIINVTGVSGNSVASISCDSVAGNGAHCVCVRVWGV